MKAPLAAPLVLGFVLASFPGFAQSSAAVQPQRVLSQALVDKFIADMPAISKEFNALAAEPQTEAGSQDSSAASSGSLGDFMDQMVNNAKANAILQRHGWGSSFWRVYSAVTTGYFLSMMDEAYAQSKEPTMKQYADQYRAAVNPADAALVARNRARLQPIFGGMGGE
ncbi:MAG TPA: hypothetical protein VMV90_12800 [Rectinemataceae bacterium]|nr:hypothetical protein [Rectinemataceae bacterium]